MGIVPDKRSIYRLLFADNEVILAEVKNNAAEYMLRKFIEEFSD